MIGSYLDEWNIVTITVRLILAVVCGGAIGLTRSVKRRGAGFKTHALVCLGSALVMMTGQYIYVDFGAISDIARLAAQVISGVGFLGVGTIMVTRDNHVKGLTTAAGLWTCAGIGLSIGIGFYSGAAITTILVLVIYRFMGRVDEIAYEHSRVLDIYIEFESRRSIAPFISVLKQNTQLNHMLNRAKAACIQCTFCTQLCPRHMLGHPLQPHRIMRKMAMNMPHHDNNETTKDHWILPELLEDKDIRQAAICSECGVCEVYACPMGLQPRVVNSLIKGELAQAGIRYSREGDTWEADANRPYRKVPTKRIAARAGVGAYYHIDGHTYKEETASKVVLPLKMNIGVPAEPVISDGVHVEKGQLIASCPEGKLGANLHASISGTAHLTGNAITITEV